jgi:hypothetical protein
MSDDDARMDVDGEAEGDNTLVALSRQFEQQMKEIIDTIAYPDRPQRNATTPSTLPHPSQ